MTRVTCANCGDRVDVPAGYTRAKIRCPACGYYAEVPADARGELVPNAAPADPFDAPLVPAGRNPAPPPPSESRSEVVGRVRANPNPRDARPVFDPEEGAGAPMLEGTRDEDDDKPYGVPGAGLKPCPHCRGQLPLHANFCVHCGKDLTSGAKAERTFQPVNRVWDEGFSHQLRMQLLVLCGILDAASCLVLAVTVSLEGVVLPVLFQVGLQVFLLGSFDQFSLKRTAKGATTLTRVRRLFMLPQAPYKFRWKQSEAVGVRSGAAVGPFAYLLLFFLALSGVGFLVGSLTASIMMLPLALIYFACAGGFYWYVVRPDVSEVVLADVYGSTDEVVFRAIDRDLAVEVARVVADATGLMHKKTL